MRSKEEKSKTSAPLFNQVQLHSKKSEITFSGGSKVVFLWLKESNDGKVDKLIIYGLLAAKNKKI